MSVTGVFRVDNQHSEEGDVNRHGARWAGSETAHLVLSSVQSVKRSGGGLAGPAQEIVVPFVLSERGSELVTRRRPLAPGNGARLTVHDDSYARLQPVLRDSPPAPSRVGSQLSASTVAVEPVVVCGALGVVCN